jgi:hypothetical protein
LGHLRKSILPALIAAALAPSAAFGQLNEDCIELEGAPPGLYATTDEGRTFLMRDDKIIEMGPGEAGFADKDGKLHCVKRTPKFLDWPCSTQAAQSRKFATYKMEDLTEDNPLQEVVRRYFEIPEVIEPVPFWIDGEYHGVFNVNDIIQFVSPDYWYTPNPNRPFLDNKRPRSLQISLYVGINQVIIDNHAIDALRKELGSEEIPVMFVFNDSNVVPVSYFGSNVSLEEVQKAFFERGIKLAEVPLWWLGDHHLAATIEEYEKFFDIPALEDISTDSQARIRADLETHGFTRKPIIVTIFSEAQNMAVDQPERVRMAASMGIKRIPTTFAFIEPDMYLARCGPGTPMGSSGVSGATTPISGAVLPPTASAPPSPELPEPPPPASES